MTYIRSRLGLCKIRISLFSALSAVTGFVLAAHALSVGIWYAAAGVFLLACGAGALNQYQEQKTDSLMERTRSRPIPSGAISPRKALVFSCILMASGVSVLAAGHGAAAPFLGLLAVLWYNGVYTRLKHITAFAPVPGALVGTISPAIGWSAGGGSLTDIRLLALCLFFFIWQVPHFWLLSVSHSDDYRKAGFPSVRDRLNAKQVSRITFIWVLSAAAAGLLMPFYITPAHGLVQITFLIAGAWLVDTGMRFGGPGKNTLSVGGAFNRINMYMLAVMLLLTGEILFI